MSVKRLIFVLVIAGYVAFIIFRPSVDPTLDVDGYFIPLAAGYGVCEPWHDPVDTPKGNYLATQGIGPGFTSEIPVRCREAGATTEPTGGDVNQFEVRDVGTVAVVGPLIVGTSGAKYFIFDTRQEISDGEPFATRFADPESWKRAMADVGIKTVPNLVDPVSLAKGAPDKLLHAQDYRVLNGPFGWPDEAWGDNVILLCTTIMFLQGLLATRQKIFLPALFLGMGAAIIADLILGDGDGQFMGGLFSLPIDFLIVGYFARLIRWTVFKLARRNALSGGALLK